MAKACLSAARMRSYAGVAASQRCGSRRQALAGRSTEAQRAAMMLGYAPQEQQLLGQLVRGLPPALRELAVTMSVPHVGAAAGAIEAQRLARSQREAAGQAEEPGRISEMELCCSGKAMASGPVKGRIQRACSACSALGRLRRTIHLAFH